MLPARATPKHEITPLSYVCGASLLRITTALVRAYIPTLQDNLTARKICSMTSTKCCRFSLENTLPLLWPTTPQGLHCGRTCRYARPLRGFSSASPRTACALLPRWSACPRPTSNQWRRTLRCGCKRVKRIIRTTSDRQEARNQRQGRCFRRCNSAGEASARSRVTYCKRREGGSSHVHAGSKHLTT